LSFASIENAAVRGPVGAKGAQERSRVIKNAQERQCRRACVMLRSPIALSGEDHE
jgi:hypothetical protein